MAKRKTHQQPSKSVDRNASTKSSKPAVQSQSKATAVAGHAPRAEKPPRLIPTLDELKSLYQRYTNAATFDDHDKAFYFVLDVGGLSRAQQLLDHVGEVLAELEELH